MAILNTSSKHGSVGWSTFQGGPHGLTERQRVWPLNPRSPAQQHIRGLVGSHAAGWRTLSEAERATWRALAGQLPGPLGACQLYIKLNVTRVNCGLPALATAPPPPAFGILVCAGLVVDDTPSVRLLQVTSTVAPEAVIIEATPRMSQGRLSPRNSFRQLAVVPGHTGPGADLDLTADYVARFGAPRAGYRMFVRLSAMTHGFRAPPVQFSAIATGQGR